MNYLILASFAWLLILANDSFTGDRLGDPAPKQEQSSVCAMRLGLADAGTLARLALGQMLILTLDANPSTGYSWEVVRLDQKLLEQAGETTFDLAPQSMPPVAGRAGTQTLRFRATGVGDTLLKLVYQPSWDTSVAPADATTFTLSVTVH